MTNSNEDIPIMAAHNDLIARVMHRNNIAQVDLADKCQLSESTISRIISGDRVVSPEVIRALYELTSDPEMLCFLFGGETISLVRPTDEKLTKSQAESRAVIACSSVLIDTGASVGTHDDGIKRMATIDKAINSLADLRRKMITNTYTRIEPTERRVVHHNGSGQLVDMSA